MRHAPVGGTGRAQAELPCHGARGARGVVLRGVPDEPRVLGEARRRPPEVPRRCRQGDEQDRGRDPREMGGAPPRACDP